MDQKRDELLYSNVKGKNPFKDKRVRQAFYQAIDINGIQRTVMRGASKPTALMVGPASMASTPAMNKRCPTTRRPPRSCWPRPVTPTASRWA
jgi:peptide/nickel transport system substrate-binding protein